MKYASSLRGWVNRLAMIAVAFGFAGCEEDDGGPIAPPAGPDIVGTWSFVAGGEPQQPASLFGEAVEVCVVGGLILTFTRDGGTLAGTMGQGADAGLICSTPDGEEVFGDLVGHNNPLEDIVLTDDGAVSFNSPGADGTDYIVSGNLTEDGDGMEGSSVTFTLSGFDGGNATFSGGAWDAERQ